MTPETPADLARLLPTHCSVCGRRILTNRTTGKCWKHRAAPPSGDAASLRATVIAALTDEDEIAHGEAVVERHDVFVGLGRCAYCDSPWPCRTQRGIERLVATLSADTP